MNSPVLYSDPTGDVAVSAVLLLAAGIVASALIGGGIGALNAWVNDKDPGAGFWGGAVGGLITGGAISAFTAGVIPMLALAGIGVLGGIAAYVTETFLNQDEFSISDIVSSALFNGLFAMLGGKISVSIVENAFKGLTSMLDKIMRTLVDAVFTGFVSIWQWASSKFSEFVIDPIENYFKTSAQTRTSNTGAWSTQDYMGTSIRVRTTSAYVSNAA